MIYDTFEEEEEEGEEVYTITTLFPADTSYYDSVLLDTLKLKHDSVLLPKLEPIKLP